MNRTKLTNLGIDCRGGHGLGVGALLLVVAVAGFAFGCGGASRQRQATMMIPQSGQLASANGGPVPGSVSGPPGTVSASVTSPGGTAAPVLVDEATYRLAPGDLLDVKFPYHPEENERVPVRPDGRINLQVVGDVNAAGRTVKELEDTIVEKASVTLRSPVVSVVIAQLAEHKVFVGGSVAKPGFVLFHEGLTPLQAVVERGGFTDDAKTSQVVYLHRVGDQVETQKIDLEAVLKGTSTDQVALAPEDIIIVPRTFIGKADIWVDQYVRGLLPTIPRPSLDLTSFLLF